jgi:hypothetical protein
MSRRVARDTYLDRPVLIHICKDGTFTWRRRGQPVFNGRALAVFSVDTEEQAREAQVLFCRRQYAPHPQLPSQPWYTWTDFTGELDALEDVTAKLRAWWQRREGRPS